MSEGPKKLNYFQYSEEKKVRNYDRLNVQGLISDARGTPITPKGLASYCQAKTTFTFHFFTLTFSNAFFSNIDKEMKSESGYSLVMASQPFDL